VLGGFYIRDENGERRSGGRQRGILIFGTCAGFLVSNSVIEVGELCLSAHIAQPNSNRWWNWGLDLGLGWNGGICIMILADFFLGLPELLDGFHSSHRFHCQWQWRPKLSRLKLGTRRGGSLWFTPKEGETKKSFLNRTKKESFFNFANSRLIPI